MGQLSGGFTKKVFGAPYRAPMLMDAPDSSPGMAVWCMVYVVCGVWCVVCGCMVCGV